MADKETENTEKVLNDKKDILFVLLFILCVLAIALFNYIVDPYYIFRKETINGFNNVKTHQFSNRREILYSDVKINTKGKDVVFTGNCLLSRYGSGLDNVVFFTVPVVKISEVSQIVKNLISYSPEIKTIYWGMFFDDFWNKDEDEDNGILPEFSSKCVELQDFINLFFSYNTTKYSIETIRDSVKNHGEKMKYVYPFREIADKTYSDKFSLDSLKAVKETVEFANEHGVKLVIYYSPINVTKKMHIYSKNQWDNYRKLKLELANVCDFYDYSLSNKYNSNILDGNSKYYLDNIHLSSEYDKFIINDLLSADKKVAKLVTKANAKSVTEKEFLDLIKFIDKNKSTYEKIKQVSIDDRFERIEKNTSEN